MTWLSGWDYRKSHIINAQAGAGTDYQVKIVVHYGDGTDSGENVYCDSKCEADFGDIRFTGSDEETLLDYWMEPQSGGSAVFWVKITEDLSTTAKTIYMYYGKDAETTTSNGASTFLAFRDLTGDFYAGLGTIGLTTYSNGSDPGDYFVSPQTVDSVSVDPCIFFRKWGGKKYAVSSTNLYFEGIYESGNYGFCGINIRNRTSAAPTGWQTSMGYPANTTLNRKHIIAGDYVVAAGGLSLYFFSTWTNNDDTPNGTAVANYGLSSTERTTFGYSYNGSLSHIRLMAHSGTQATVYSAFYAIAKYVTPEPQHGSWGNEETDQWEVIDSNLEVTGDIKADQQIIVPTLGSSGGLVIGTNAALYSPGSHHLSTGADDYLTINGRFYDFSLLLPNGGILLNGDYYFKGDVRINNSPAANSDSHLYLKSKDESTTWSTHLYNYRDGNFVLDVSKNCMVDLSDDAGTSEFIIRDSGFSHVASINSNGQLHLPTSGSSGGIVTASGALVSHDYEFINTITEPHPMVLPAAYSTLGHGNIMFKDTTPLPQGVAEEYRYPNGRCSSLYLVMVEGPDPQNPGMYDPIIAASHGLWVEKDIQAYGALMTSSDPGKGYGGGAIQMGHSFTAASDMPCINLTDIDYQTLWIKKNDGVHAFMADLPWGDMELGDLTAHGTVQASGYKGSDGRSGINGVVYISGIVHYFQNGLLVEIGSG